MLRTVTVLACVCGTALGADPIALHQLVEVGVAGDVVIRLTGYDYDGDMVRPRCCLVLVSLLFIIPCVILLFQLTYRILEAPTSGKLYQLSQVFSAYGYNPKAGVQISSGDTIVTGSIDRVYYKRPSPDAASNSKVYSAYTATFFY